MQFLNVFTIHGEFTYAATDLILRVHYDKDYYLRVFISHKYTKSIMLRNKIDMGTWLYSYLWLHPDKYSFFITLNYSFELSILLFCNVETFSFQVVFDSTCHCGSYWPPFSWTRTTTTKHRNVWAFYCMPNLWSYMWCKLWKCHVKILLGQPVRATSWHFSFTYCRLYIWSFWLGLNVKYEVRMFL